MVKVKAVNEKDEQLVDQECDVAVMFLVKGTNMSATISGGLTLELIEQLRKQVPKAFKNFIGNVEKHYKEEELKMKAIKKVEEAMKRIEE
jgi:hypothetical protein